MHSLLVEIKKAVLYFTFQYYNCDENVFVSLATKFKSKSPYVGLIMNFQANSALNSI